MISKQGRINLLKKELSKEEKSLVFWTEPKRPEVAVFIQRNIETLEKRIATVSAWA